MANDWMHALSRFNDFSPGNRTDARLFFAPGRVNLIGEHTDYNGGYVLPAALTLGTWLFVRQRNDGIFRFGSTFSPLEIVVDGKEISYRSEQDFANYPLGMIKVLANEGVAISGGDFFFHGNLPVGAGLSSSASIEVVTGVAVCALADAAIAGERVARLAQQAENEFVGVHSGIMDQFAVTMGKTDCALSLNCATLEYQSVPVHAGAYRLVIANTNVQRTLAGSKYNERRAECEKALTILRTKWPSLSLLAEIDSEMWNAAEHTLRGTGHAERLDSEEIDVIVRRARHVVFENARAKKAAALLEEGQLIAFGASMNESHRSLRDDYEVTGEALDTLAEAAWAAPGCIGSRMTGAGFGGCTVSLVHEDHVDEFQDSVATAYQARMGIAPSFYVTELGDGPHEIDMDALLK